MLESKYKTHLIKEIETFWLPDSICLIQDPNIRQGIPDLLILNWGKWAALEVKISEKANIQPNQPYYIELMDRMSYAAFIYPENEEEILRGLQHALEPSRFTRLS